MASENGNDDLWGLFHLVGHTATWRSPAKAVKRERVDRLRIQRSYRDLLHGRRNGRRGIEFRAVNKRDPFLYKPTWHPARAPSHS